MQDAKAAAHLVASLQGLPPFAQDGLSNNNGALHVRGPAAAKKGEPAPARAPGVVHVLEGLPKGSCCRERAAVSTARAPHAVVMQAEILAEHVPALVAHHRKSDRTKGATKHQPSE